MLPRERVETALAFHAPDKPPVEYHPSPGGLYDHGEGLRELWREFPQDFGPVHADALSRPPADAFDPDGRYHEFVTDPWGVVWEQRLFGVYGHPVRRPLDDWRALNAYRAPPVPVAAGSEFTALQAREEAIGRSYYRKRGWLDLMETLRAVRRYEDILMDLAEDVPEAHRLADLILDRQTEMEKYLILAGTDALQMADDWGGTGNLLVSPDLWRRFFKPRYRRLFAPALAAGKKVFFHSCGWIWPILEDLAELGVAAIWPQLNLYHLPELIRKCRDLGLAVAIHPDRGDLLQRGKPETIRAEVFRLAEAFRIQDGGSWFYLEVDPNFPWPNVQALFSAVAELRGR